MFDMVQSIQPGPGGIVMKFKTWEEFVPKDIFRKFMVTRRARLVICNHRIDSDNTKEFMFLNTEDIERFMNWLTE